MTQLTETGSDCETMLIRPIAHIRTDFPEKFGVPRQSGRVSELLGKIFFCRPFRDMAALRGLEGFSHIWLIFGFSKVNEEQTHSLTVRPPRLGGNQRVGVFASRSPFRPNRLGLSSVRLCGIELSSNGPSLTVSGADLVDGTPIYDIKPYLPFADAHPAAAGGYAATAESHRLHVIASEKAFNIIPEEKRRALLSCIAEDPRPSYQNDANRIYSMSFSGFTVHFTVSGNTAIVTDTVKEE